MGLDGSFLSPACYPLVREYRLDLKHQGAIEGFGVGCDLDRAENFRRIDQRAVFGGREQGGMSTKSRPCPQGLEASTSGQDDVWPVL